MSRSVRVRKGLLAQLFRNIKASIQNGKGPHLISSDPELPNDLLAVHFIAGIPEISIPDVPNSGFLSIPELPMVEGPRSKGRNLNCAEPESCIDKNTDYLTKSQLALPPAKESLSEPIKIEDLLESLKYHHVPVEGVKQLSSGTTKITIQKISSEWNKQKPELIKVNRR